MVFKIAKEEVFIPKFSGNDKLPEDEKIKIGIRFPSAVDVFNVADNSNDNNVLFTFLLYVKWVENLVIEDEKGKREAKPEDIPVTPELIGLYVEIKRHLDKYVSIDKKKLESD